MIMKLFFVLLLLLSSVSHQSITAITPPVTIGITFTKPQWDPIPEDIVNTVQSINVSSIQIIDPNPIIISSFVGTNISLMLVMPQDLVANIAANASAALPWLEDNVFPFFDRLQILYISVGIFQPVDNRPLAPVVDIVHGLLDARNIPIKVSATFTFLHLIKFTTDPKSAKFHPSYAFLNPLLDVLHRTKSPFFVSIHPYAVSIQKPRLGTQAAMFDNQRGLAMNRRLSWYGYYNLFDIMLDSVINAIHRAGYNDIKIVVTETGWPVDPHNTGLEEVENQEKYIQGLLDHLKSRNITDLANSYLESVYIFELFDTPNQPFTGLTAAKNIKGLLWGLFYSSETPKFNISNVPFETPITEPNSDFYERACHFAMAVAAIFGIIRLAVKMQRKSLKAR